MQTEIKILKSLNLEELHELISVFQEVFEMENTNRPNKIYLQGLLNKETFFAIIARNENKIIGGLTVYVLDQYYTEKQVAYV